MATWVPPDACTLPTEQQPLRVAEFDQLFAQSLESVTRLREGEISLLLVGDGSLLEAARDLAERETSCCSFFTFTVRRVADRVEMRVMAPAAHASIVSALADRAESMMAERAT